MDGAANAWIGAAAANLAKIAVDVGVSWLRMFLQERRRRHDLSRLAVAALRHILGEPGLLHRVLAVGRQAFDCGDGLADNVADLDTAGAHGLAVHMHGAGAAQRDAATKFCSGQSDFVADVESPGGISPPGAPRSVREPLDSHGSRCSAVGTRGQQLYLVHGLLLLPVGFSWPVARLNNAAPSLQPHYRTFITTTGCSAPVLRIGTLVLTVLAALDFSLCIGATGSHVPYKSQVELRAAYMPDTGRAGFRVLPN